MKKIILATPETEKQAYLETYGGVEIQPTNFKHGWKEYNPPWYLFWFPKMIVTREVYIKFMAHYMDREAYYIIYK